jgi:ATP phosphoribosyltransferase
VIDRCGPSLATGRFRFPTTGPSRPRAAPIVLRIALPNKGRLADDARELFADAGLPVKARGERALTASLGGEFEAIFVRARTSPSSSPTARPTRASPAGTSCARATAASTRCSTSASGAAASSSPPRTTGACARSTTSARLTAGRPVRVATVFPHITRRFFAEAGRSVEIAPISGAVEIAPHLGIADVIVDLTSTGSTLRTNGLREIATVLESTARLVAAPGALAGGGAEPTARQRSVDELVTALASVLRARDKRYVMANVPRAALDRVKQVLPGLNGPTVIDIMNGGTMVAVHAVVAAATIYRTIAQLKALGGEGILVTRIERLMP